MTTDVEAAKSFALDTRVVLEVTKILKTVTSHRFTVSSEPREEGGYTFIDLVQMAGNTFVS